MTNLLAIIIACMIQVESGGDDYAVSPNGKCVGALQLELINVADANRILGRPKWTGMDRYSRKQSIEMTTLVLSHYMKPTWTIQQVVLCHKCGIRGMKTPDAADLAHAKRVENLVMEELKNAKDRQQKEDREGTKPRKP